jgi:hypothetical protein
MVKMCLVKIGKAKVLLFTQKTLLKSFQLYCIVDKHAPFIKLRIKNKIKIGLALGSVQSCLKSYTTEMLPGLKLDSQTRAQTGSLSGD